MISMGFDRYGLDKRQPIVGFIVLILTIVWAITLNQKAGSLPMALVAGLMIGYTLTRSRYGFAGGVKRIFYRGEGSLTIALLVMLATTALINFCLLYTSPSPRDTR